MNTFTPAPGDTLHLRDAGSIVAAVPHLLGFIPDDSIVLLVLSGHELVMTARFDLTPALALPTGRLFGDLLRQSARLQGDAIVALLYGPRGRTRRARGLVRRGLAPWLDLTLVVDPAAGRWWTEDDPLSAPGQPLDPDPAVEDWADRGGYPVAPSRERLLDGLQPPSGAREDRLTALWAEVEARLASRPPLVGQAAMAAYLHRPASPWSEADYVTAALLLRQPGLRDQLWAAATRGAARDLLGFWSEVVRHTPVAHRVVPLAVAGFLAWLAGQGALSAVCHEECLDLDPAAPVVGLLTTIRRHAIHPDAWEPAWARSAPGARRPPEAALAA
ncbi:MAG: DUF4192 domain-containing protein [Propionibacteriaceae bacterium]|jgi:hypothetical protein|nr:DUF4192 domain-containing protein [Propionibacteriaceae bacterium]